MTRQFLFGNTDRAPSPSATTYSAIFDGRGAWSAVESRYVSLVSTGGVFSNFKVQIDSAPGAGKSYIFTIRKGASGGAMADTTLSVTIAGTDTQSSADTDSVTVSAGDKISISATPSGTPASAGDGRWTVQFTPTTTGETLLLGSSDANILANEYGALNGQRYDANATVEFDYQTLFPTAGTLKNFYVELTVAPGAGTSRTFTIRKNGVATSIVVTISDTSVTGSDLVNTVSIVAGDKLSVINTVTGAPALSKAGFGSTFLPTNVGEYFVSLTTSDTIAPGSAWTLLPIVGINRSFEIVETNAFTLSPDTVIAAKKMYVELAAAPGAGKTLVFTLRDDSVNTSLAVSISETNTSGNASVDVAIATGSLLSHTVDATNGPAVSGHIQISILFVSSLLVTTDDIVDIVTTTATGIGTMHSLGTPPVSQHGHCWATTPNPTTADSKTTNGVAVLGRFTSAMTGLVAGKKYYVRAYATDALTTVYGVHINAVAGAPALTRRPGEIGIFQTLFWYVDGYGVLRYLEGTPA